MCITPASKRGVVAEGRRREGWLSVALPNSWTAKTVRCNLFATDARGYASSSLYVVQSRAPLATALNQQSSTAPLIWTRVRPSSMMGWAKDFISCGLNFWSPCMGVGRSMV